MRCQTLPIRIFFICALLLATASLAAAQDLPGLGTRTGSWDVFLQSDADGETELVFIDRLTGESQRHSAPGERHTLLPDGVIYFDRAERQVKLAAPESDTREHPFVRLGAGDKSVDWAVSHDQSRIAWSISRDYGDGGLVSTVFHAHSAGTDIRELLTYGPRPGLRLAPVAFSAANDALYVDVHPEGAGDLKPYPWHTGMFSLRLADGAIETLPGNASCLCAVGFGGDEMLRLTPNESGAIEVEARNLADRRSRVIPALSPGDYGEAGNLLINEEGTAAVYALSRVSGFGAAAQEIETALALVDLESETQVAITDPMPYLLRPIQWTEGGGAITFTARGRNATWKISLVDGRLTRVAEARYLGALDGSS